MGNLNTTAETRQVIFEGCTTNWRFELYEGIILKNDALSRYSFTNSVEFFKEIHNKALLKNCLFALKVSKILTSRLNIAANVIFSNKKHVKRTVTSSQRCQT